MSRRDAEPGDRAPLRMVRPSGPSDKRTRYLPVADLLAREGKPLEPDDEFLVADAVASVRRGMAGLAVGLLAIVGAGTILDKSLSTDQDPVAEQQGRPSADSRIVPSTVDTPAREQDRVKRVAKPAQRTLTASMRGQKVSGSSAGTRQSSQQAAAPQPEPQPAPTQQAPSQSDTNWQDSSGNYGQDYSGNYGRDYWDWGG